MLKLIPDWKQAYKFLSVQVAMLIVLLASLQEVLPDLKEHLPGHWYAGLAILVAVARVLAQPKLMSPETVEDKRDV